MRRSWPILLLAATAACTPLDPALLATIAGSPLPVGASPRPSARASIAATARPSASPGAYYLAQGWNTTFTHQGEAAHAVDLSMPEGSDVCAAREGMVIATNAGSTRGGTTDEFKDLQLTNFIYVRHADGTHARYLHLAPGGVLVTPGQAVRRGEVIGKSGDTGFSEAPHLHFEVTAPVDGTRSRSLSFRWRAERGAPTGVEPVEGAEYTAFE